jgi:hypothetical protein
MRGPHESPLAHDPDLVLNLVLKVREMVPHRPGRWAWELRDRRDGSCFESMWEFDSAARAGCCGRSRLGELIQSLSDAKALAQWSVSPDGHMLGLAA